MSQAYYDRLHFFVETLNRRSERTPPLLKEARSKALWEKLDEICVTQPAPHAVEPWIDAGIILAKQLQEKILEKHEKNLPGTTPDATLFLETKEAEETLCRTKAQNDFDEHTIALCIIKLRQLAETHFPELSYCLPSDSMNKVNLFHQLLEQFREAVKISIEHYQQQFPWRARQKERARNCAELKAIAEDPTHTHVESLIKALESYLLDEKKFDPGYLNRSELENVICRCIFNYDPIYRKAKKIFGEVDQPVPALPETKQDKEIITIPPTHEDLTLQVRFKFEDFIELAIDKYCERKSCTKDTLPEHRKLSLQRIEAILKNTTQTPQEKIKAIRCYLNNEDPTHPFLKSFMSDLKKQLLTLLADYEAIVQRGNYPIQADGSFEKTIHCHHWKPLSGETKARIFYQHGWRDSANTATPLAQLLQHHDIETWAPDNWGHGLDELERGNTRSFKRLSADMLRLTMRRTLQQLNDASPLPSGVFAHSLGAAIAVTETRFIEQLSTIKALYLQAPALSYPGHRNLTNPFNRKEALMSPEALFAYRHHSQPIPSLTTRRAFPARRNGSRALPLISLLQMMREAFEAFVRLITGKTQQERKLPIHCISGKRDTWGIHSVLEHMKKIQSPAVNNMSFETQERAGHFMEPRYRNTYLEQTTQHILRIFDIDRPSQSTQLPSAPALR